MKTFAYELVYADGRRARGRILAKNSKEAINKLQDSAGKVVFLQPIVDSVNEKAKISVGSSVLFIANLNLRLVGQLRAGIALRKALENIQNAGTGAYTGDLQSVIAALDNGRSLSEALAARHIFPSFMVAMVTVGEATGDLDSILQDVADYYFELYELQMHLKQIALYPLLLCVMIFGMLMAFIVFVVPSFASLYAMLNIELHGVLRGLLFVKEHLLLLLLLVVAGTIVLIAYVRRRCAVDKNYLLDMLLQAPVIGEFVRILQEVRFCRVMHMQLQAGVDILSAISVARACVRGSALQEMLVLVESELTRGIGLYEAARLHNVFLSADTLAFIAVAEDGNGYAQMFALAHHQAGFNLKNITAGLRTYLQPLIFLMTAVALGTVIIVLLQPMLGVLENIGSNW